MSRLTDEPVFDSVTPPTSRSRTQALLLGLGGLAFLLQQVVIGLHVVTTHHFHVVEGAGDVAVLVEHAHAHDGLHEHAGDAVHAHSHGGGGYHEDEGPAPEEEHPEELVSPATAPASGHVVAVLLVEGVAAPCFVSPWSASYDAPTSGPRAPPPTRGAPPRAPPVRA